MNLTLTSQDQADFLEATRVVLAPQDYPDADAWRSAVSRSVKALVGADKTVFGLEVPGIQHYVSNEIDRGVLAHYPNIASDVQKRVGTIIHRPGVYHRDQVWASDPKAYYRSTYYNDYIVPIRAFDAIIVGVCPSQGVQSSSQGVLIVHHENPHGLRFSERGLQMLRLFRPAFESGIRTYRMLHEHRSGLVHTVDALGQSLMVCDRAGQVLHQTPALTTALEVDPEGEHLRAHMIEVARALAGAKDISPPLRLVQTRLATYRICGSYMGVDEWGPDSYILVALDRTTLEVPSEASLQKRFGLTRQEARVALLLTERKRNDEIADVLCISPHTARHHTERVLEKAGVHTRTDLARVLSEVTAAPTI